MIPLQWGILGKMIALWQAYALLLIGVGAFGLSFGDITAAGTAHDAPSAQHDYIVGVAFIVGKIVVSAVALIVNEKQLKELPLTVDAYNVVAYSFGMAFLGAGVGLWELTAATKQPPMMSVLIDIVSDPWMFSAVLLMAILGVVCAYLLKAYSAMEKEVFSSGVVALLAVAGILTPGENLFGFWTIECALIITIGTFAYLANEPPKKDASAAPASKQDEPPKDTSAAPASKQDESSHDAKAAPASKPQ